MTSSSSINSPLIKGSFEGEFESPHSPDRVWQVLGAFTDVSWLPGVERAEIVQRSGRTTRLLFITGMDTPVEEQLISQDDARHCMTYHVVKNPFVPYEEYQAEVRLGPAGSGTLISFKSGFLVAEGELEAARTNLFGAYQMMVDAVNETLADQPPPQ